MIVVPKFEGRLARGIGEADRRYTRGINLRVGWAGYLWQERLASFPLDQDHLWTAVRYVLLNPVRAKLVRRAEEWPSSSAAEHLFGASDGIVDLTAYRERAARPPPYGHAPHTGSARGFHACPHLGVGVAARLRASAWARAFSSAAATFGWPGQSPSAS